MLRNATIFIGIIRAIAGIMVGLIGMGFQSTGSEGWAFLFYLVAMAIGIVGATRVLVNGAITVVLVFLWIAMYWLWFKNATGVPLSAFFESQGPDWWRYFWWVPVSLLLTLGLLAVVIYRLVEGPNDKDGG